MAIKNSDNGDPNEQRLVQMVDEARDEIVNLCADLIKIDSVNYGKHIYNSLDSIYTFVKSVFDKEKIAYEEYRCPFPTPVNGQTVSYPNLVASLNGQNSEQAKTLMFCGHLDVVPYYREAWDPEIDPIGGLVKDGLLYGRGATDMKSGCACMMMAMILLKRSGIPINGTLKSYFIPDEESNSEYGAQFMTREHLDSIKADAIIIGESTSAGPDLGPVVVLGEKGMQWFKLTFFGASGHGSMPKPKSNVINKANKFIQMIPKIKFKQGIAPVGKFEMLKTLVKRLGLKKLVKMMLESAERPLYDEDGNDISIFFKTTVSVNIFSAGKKENLIPSKGELVLDIRVLPGVDTNDIFKSLSELATKLGYRIEFPEGYYQQPQNKKLSKRPVDIKVEIINSELGNFSPANHDILQIFDKTFEKFYGMPSIHFFAPGSTDGTHLRKYGLNTYVFGPGNGQTAHGENESVEIDDIIKATKVYLISAYRYLKNGK
jgi:acetylornithine deacetylase/succinyl-diaminopimelate desuccinylase-like protein